MIQKQTKQAQKTVFIVTQIKIYDPYGAILGGGQVSRYQYEGKEFSEVTEDYDFNFRKYNPELGIFTQPEQTFPNVYDPQQLNRYRFERNNPYKYVDPSGEIPVTVIAGIVAGVAVGSIQGYITYRETGGDLTKAIVSGGIAAVATGVSVATLGATSVIGGASRIGARYIAPTGIRYAARTGALFTIGGLQSYTEQKYVGESKELSYAQIGIYGTTNAFLGPNQFRRVPGVIARQSGQAYPYLIGQPLISEARSLGLTSSYTNYFVNLPLSSISNQLFTPYSPPSSSSNQIDKSSGGGSRNYTPANGCGVIMSCA